MKILYRHYKKSLYGAIIIIILFISYALFTIATYKTYSDSRLHVNIILNTTILFKDIRYWNFDTYNEAFQHCNEINADHELFNSYMPAMFESANHIVITIGKSHVSYGILENFGIRKEIISRYIVLLFLVDNNIIYQRIIKYDNNNNIYLKI